MVIQGPPGTGKSQTITNIIAAALGEGKSVLFVAEKMAALEVVKKRLDAVGLGDFCLELHSHKTRKSEVLKALRSRLDKRPPMVVQGAVDAAIAERAQAQAKLNHYVQRMNEPAGDTGLTVHALLSGSCARDSAFVHLPPALSSARLPNPLLLTPHKRADLGELALALEDEQYRIAPYGTWTEQPWRGVQNRDLARHQRGETLDSIRRWRGALFEAQSIVARFCETTGTQPVESITAIERLVEPLPRIEKPSDAVLLPLLVATVDEAERGALRTFAETVLRRSRIRASIADHTDAEAALAIDGGRLARVAKTASELGLDEFDRSHVDRISVQARGEAQTTGAYLELAEELARRLGMQLLKPRALSALCACVQITSRFPRHLLMMRETSVISEASARVLRDAAQQSAHIEREGTELAQAFALSLVPAAATLRDAERIVRGGAGIWSWLFNRRYRHAIQLHRSVLRAPSRMAARIVADNLGQLAAHYEARAAFECDGEIRAACGGHFQGFTTRLDDLVAVSEWAARIRAATIAHSTIRSFFLAGPIEQVDAILALASDSAFAGLCECTTRDKSIEQQHADAKRRADELEGLAADLAMIGFRKGLSLERLSAVRTQIADYHKTDKQLATLKRAKEILAATTPTDVSPDRVLETVRYADHLFHLDLAGDVARWLLRNCSAGSFDTLRMMHQDASNALDEVEAALASVQSSLQLVPAEWCGAHTFKDASVATLLARIDRAMACPDALDPLVSFLRVEENAGENGLDPVLRAFRQGGHDYRELRLAFDAVFFRSAAEALLHNDQWLRSHSGQTHEAVRRRFQQLDRQVMKLGQQALAARLMQRTVPEGNGKGPRGTWTECALIQHQISLQRRHASLRSLLDRAGNAIRALKPCFMMSPMSVAQYLAPGHSRFDLVVMDEASQMRPEDALGAIARASQVVVVGDPEQLPPTTFFEKQDSEDMDDAEGEELGVDGQESILDLAKSSFGPIRLLNWHYRSRHAGLIAFSNRHFYGNRLVVFPSPREDDPMHGVKLVNVQGTYSHGRNEIEADAIVEAVLEFVQHKPDWSLAIVAMNSAQRELIAEKVDAAFAADPTAEAYRSSWADGMEPLVVKNLENVQGDERDAVFISTVYGPDEAGTFAQRFGPINLQMGHRRLNVLFTRAKHTLRVFTSMSPESIRADGASRGVGVLREFLIYARDGHTPDQGPTAGEPENDFERWFVERLTARGHDVVPQFGVAGYRIDLAIRHPSKPGSFILGVECDGATYHGSRAARDRDRLRQEVLERLGWHLHRVWSTDWFRNPERELEIILEKVKRLQLE